MQQRQQQQEQQQQVSATEIEIMPCLASFLILAAGVN